MVPSKTLVVNVLENESENLQSPNDLDISFFTQYFIIHKREKKKSDKNGSHRKSTRGNEYRRDQPEFLTNIMKDKKEEIRMALRQIKDDWADKKNLSRAANNLKIVFQNYILINILTLSDGNELLKNGRDKDAFKVYQLKNSKFSDVHKRFFKLFVESETFSALIDTIKNQHKEDPVRKRALEFM
jgi:hypothetical protein